MEKIVESKIFTDEQKVSVIKAVLEKSIVLDFVPEFCTCDHYYFIKNGATYQYVMTFVDGFKWMNLGVPQDEFVKQFVFNKFSLTNSVIYCVADYIVVYNKKTVFPYMRYNFVHKTTIYFRDGKNAELIENLFRSISRSTSLVHFAEYAAKNDINLVSHKVDDIVDISFNFKVGAFVLTYTDGTYQMCNTKAKEKENKEKEIEKDKFMLAIDSFGDSETLKKTIYSKKIENYKQRIITGISKAIENNENSFETYKGELYSTPEITGFLKYICDTKKYTITTNNLSFQIIFY